VVQSGPILSYAASVNKRMSHVQLINISARTSKHDQPCSRGRQPLRPFPII